MYCGWSNLNRTVHVFFTIADMVLSPIRNRNAFILFCLFIYGQFAMKETYVFQTMTCTNEMCNYADLTTGVHNCLLQRALTL